jgi:hypothetical protein
MQTVEVHLFITKFIAVVAIELTVHHSQNDTTNHVITSCCTLVLSPHNLWHLLIQGTGIAGMY